jgi:spore cortex formation protein SpoVR/YcgB (stage V sporulation)
MTIIQDNPWHLFEFLVGAWKGTGGGEPGIGEYERTYQFIFNYKFLEVKNKSTYPPTEQSPQGEVHQDIGYISYDKARRTFVMRQFHVEGFVNQYILESISEDERVFVFTSEAIENIPTGWRARETYQVASDKEFTETFELAAPGKEFEVYTRITLRK